MEFTVVSVLFVITVNHVYTYTCINYTPTKTFAHARREAALAHRKGIVVLIKLLKHVWQDDKPGIDTVMKLPKKEKLVWQDGESRIEKDGLLNLPHCASPDWKI